MMVISGLSLMGMLFLITSVIVTIEDRNMAKKKKKTTKRVPDDQRDGLGRPKHRATTWSKKGKGKDPKSLRRKWKSKKRKESP
jgi:putative Ca2+/H+ antiporter (TMEM165/GDT1 family)